MENTATPTTTYGNLEITVEGMNKEQLNALLDFVTEKVESMSLVMVARAYMTTDDDYDEDETEGMEDAEKPESTKEG
jgi:hypothetical protein